MGSKEQTQGQSDDWPREISLIKSFPEETSTLGSQGNALQKSKRWAIVASAAF